MEAWTLFPKLLDYPAAALNATTSRWGLEPFPPSLIAINGSGDEVKYIKWPKYNFVLCDENSSSAIRGDVRDDQDICTYLRTCSEPSCAIIIEGIGQRTVGPANGDIVGLAYGIVTLIVGLILVPAAAATM